MSEHGEIDKSIKSSVLPSIGGSAIHFTTTVSKIKSVAEAPAHVAELKKENAELRDVNKNAIAEGRKDELTGLPNRRAAREKYEEMISNISDIEHRRESDSPIVAVFIDIDDFKGVNSKHGHNGGDRAIRQVGSSLEHSFRESEDFLARLGGDEFLALLAGTEAENAMIAAERARARVQAEDSEFGVSVTACVAVVDTSLDFDNMYDAASKAVVLAKANGEKNQVHFIPDTTSSMAA